ncbi:MAG: hypothetical protein KDC98_20685 [Planctomycetes bacterium]|nr:hypothetical protein [Planctomycetota bacterium]
MSIARLLLIARRLMGAGFMVLAAMKLVGGYDSGYLIAEPMFYCSGIVEGALGIALLPAVQVRWALVTVLAFSAVGVLVHLLLFSEGATCGCLAGVRLFEYQEFVLLSTAGLLSIACLAMERTVLLPLTATRVKSRGEVS